MIKEKLDNFIGQEKIKQMLDVFIIPKIEKNENVEHILLEGMSGTGKTTLAKILSRDKIKIIMGPSIKTKADVLAIFTSIEDGDFLFIDEVHRIEKEMEEIIYQIMDDKKISVSIGKVGDSNIINFDVPNFTLVCATTMSGMLSKPFKDRFSFRFKMDDYSIEDIIKILKINLNQITIKDIDIKMLANNCKFTPRVAVNIAKRLNDYASYLGKDLLSSKDVQGFINIIGLQNGLNKVDLEYLSIIYKNGGILGISTICKNLQIEQVNIVCDIEPYLISQEYILITPKGRKITEKGILQIKKV